MPVPITSSLAARSPRRTIPRPACAQSTPRSLTRWPDGDGPRAHEGDLRAGGGEVRGAGRGRRGRRRRQDGDVQGHHLRLQHGRDQGQVRGAYTYVPLPAGSTTCVKVEDAIIFVISEQLPVRPGGGGCREERVWRHQEELLKSQERALYRRASKRKRKQIVM